MSENIIHVQEKVELRVGDALIARQKSHPNFTALGPPDLCVVVKDYTPPKFLPNIVLKPQRFSYLHWVMGMDASSSYLISNYLDLLISNQDKKGVSRGSYTISSLHYVTYNAFQNMDLHVEITKPDNLAVVYALTNTGLRYENIDDLFWRQTALSQILRYINGPPSDARPIRMFHSLIENSGEESRFLTLCGEFFPQAYRLGSLEIPSKNSKPSKLVDPSTNLLITSITKYFTQYNRYDNLINFFSTWRESCPFIQVSISDALTLDGDLTKARALLETALAEDQNNSSLMNALVELTIKEVQSIPNHEDREPRLLEALHLALRSASLQPNNTRGWFCVAKVLINMYRYEWALVTLNHTPTTEVSEKFRNLDRLGLSLYDKITNPPLVPHDVFIEIQEEYKLFEQQEGEETLKLLSASNLSGDAKLAFDLLGQIVSRVGWEALTKTRERVLVKPAELERERFKKDKLLGLDKRMEEAAIADSLTEGMVETNSDISDTLSNPTITPQNFRRNEQGERKEEAKARESRSEFEPLQTIQEQNEGENVKTEKTESEKVESEQVQAKEKELESTDGEKIQDEEETVTDETTIIENQEKTPEQTPLPPSEPATPSLSSVSVKNIQDEEERIENSNSEITKDTTENQQAEEFSLKTTDSKLEEVRLTPESSTRVEKVPVQFRFSDSATQTEPDVVDLEMAGFLLKNRRGRKFASPPFSIDIVSEAESILEVPITDISQLMEISFHSLFQDIKAFHTWKEEEKAVSSAVENLNISSTKINPERSKADWVRLGLVASRLNFKDEAEKLFLLAGAHTVAWSGLLEIYAEKGDIRSTIVMSSTIQKFFQDKYHITQAHPLVIVSVLKVMALYGLQKVRNTLSSIPECHSVIPNILFDSVKWRSKCYDQ